VGWLPVGLVVGGSDDVGKRVTERMPQVVCAACGAEVVVMHRGPGLLLCVCGVWREVSVFSSTSPQTSEVVLAPGSTGVVVVEQPFRQATLPLPNLRLPNSNVVLKRAVSPATRLCTNFQNAWLHQSNFVVRKKHVQRDNAIAQ
jgi:hypothetical protein